MKALLRLSALFAVAALVAWAAGAQPRGTVPVGPRPTPPPEPAISENAVIVWYADSRCPPAVEAIVLPPRALRDCLSLQARLAVARIVARDRVQIGSASPCYPFYGVERTNCLDVAARTLAGVSYGQSHRWVRGLRVGEPWEGCAHGVSGDPVFVSLHDPSNVNATTAWEQANSWLWLVYDRIDLTDGPIVSEATSAALTACGL